MDFEISTSVWILLISSFVLFNLGMTFKKVGNYSLLDKRNYKMILCKTKKMIWE